MVAIDLAVEPIWNCVGAIIGGTSNDTVTYNIINTYALNTSCVSPSGLKLATKYAENRRLVDDISRTVVAEVIKKVDDLPMTEDARKRIHQNEEPATPPTPEDIETALMGTL